MTKANKVDRVTQLRDAFPELSDDQARMLLVLHYRNLRFNGVKETHKEMQKYADWLCTMPIQGINEMLSLCERYAGTF